MARSSQPTDIHTGDMKKTRLSRILGRIWAIVVLPAMLSVASPAFAQEDYRYDMGGGIGMTGYLGDAGNGNLWAHPGWDLELLFRYLPSPRWGIKTNLYAGGLSGNSADMDNVLPAGQQFKFSTTFFELGEMAEFNFFSYGIGEKYRKLKRWTPYIAAGLSFTLWTTDGKVHFTPVIPLGGGVKYKISERLNLGLEFLMKKTFSDRLDGTPLSDPYQIKSSFAKNTDWYSTLTFTISYEFSKRCAVCNYKE